MASRYVPNYAIGLQSNQPSHHGVSNHVQPMQMTMAPAGGGATVVHTNPQSQQSHQQQTQQNNQNSGGHKGYKIAQPEMHIQHILPQPQPHHHSYRIVNNFQIAQPTGYAQTAGPPPQQLPLGSMRSIQTAPQTPPQQQSESIMHPQQQPIVSGQSKTFHKGKG